MSIALDRVGIVPAKGATRGEIEAFAEENGFEILRRLPQRILILGVEQRSRAELVAFARDLRRTREVVGQAGLAVTPEGADTPMVLIDQFIAAFQSGVSREEIESFNADRGVEILLEDPFADKVFLLGVTDESEQDALDMANAYHESSLTEFGEPNFVVAHKLRRPVPPGARSGTQKIPNDPLFKHQWHHKNTGQNGGTKDADLDTPQAWDITTGDKNTVIAVLDNGFDADDPNPHPDLAPNFWQNPKEIDNGSDDDNNPYIDDLHGWDFYQCSPDDDYDGQIDEDPNGNGDEDGDGQIDEDPPQTSACGGKTLVSSDYDGDGLFGEDWFDGFGRDNDGDGRNDEDEGAHGTAVAGAATAEGDNGKGVTGTCSDCRLMLLRKGVTFYADRAAIQYARKEGADVITNSWGYAVRSRPNAVVRAIKAAKQSGIVVFWALSNVAWQEKCGSGLGTLPSVFSVASSNNVGKRAASGYGDCMEMLAPTYQGFGTLSTTTTDIQARDGYNTNAAGTGCATSSGSDLGNQSYTHCFGGNSFATPAVAGVAGLVLSENSALKPQQVERLLQDTGDKIEDSEANYKKETGFSDPNQPPLSGNPVASTHGWGRVNAFEAVRVAKQGIDVFVRDHRLDWGNTEQPSSVKLEVPRSFMPWWHSVDVKVDAPPYQLSSSANASDFATLKNEDPISGLKNRVYVRVRNRGPSSASSVSVTLRYAFAGTSLPRWQSGWTNAPIGQKTLSTVPYSGSSVAASAGGPGDPAQVVRFEWTAPAPKAGQPDPDHFCLLVELGAGPQDPSTSRTGLVRNVVPHDNNFALDNVSVVNSATSLPPDGFLERFHVRNPFEEPIDTRLTLAVPAGWEAFFEELPRNEPIPLDPGEQRLATLRVVPPERGAEGEVRVVQKAQLGEEQEPVVLGGMTYRFRPWDGRVASSGFTIGENGRVDFPNTGVDIRFSGTEGSGPVVVERFNTGPAGTEGIDEENVSSYRFTVASKGDLSVGSDTEVRLDASRLDGIDDPANVRVYKRSTPSEGPFEPLSTTYDEEAGELVAKTGSFSEFVLASNSEPLPVELASFDATQTGNSAVQLTWTTASEQNNAGFEVQHRSVKPSRRDGSTASSAEIARAWKTIGFVEGHGTTTKATRYRFVAENLAVGTHRFRLKQVDLDGTTHLYDPVVVELEMQQPLRLSAPAPNPVSGSATVTFAVRKKKEVTLALYNTLGQRVRTVYRGTPPAGEATPARIETSGLPSGVYFLRLRADGQTKTRRLTVLR